MNGFTITHSGILTTLQDAGRIAWQHLGISRCGPMDWHAAAWANRLVGNEATSPLLEVTIGGLQLTAQTDSWVAITGADVRIELDGEQQNGWSRFFVQKGQHLKLGYARAGQRLYMAVPHGFQAESILNSVATQSREKLGGLHRDGSALKKGDVLNCTGDLTSFCTRATVPPRYIPNFKESTMTLNVLLGGDAAQFQTTALDAFFAQAWKIGKHSNRIKIRLQGNSITPPKRQWSLGVSPGTIQVPPDGNPIILAADCQSMGGYPILGWLCPLSLYRLSQCQAGQQVNFKADTLDTIQARMQRFQRFFNLHCC